MKYVLTGSAGNITKPLAENLLAAGHEVVVIGRNKEHLQPLVEHGALAAIGSVEDQHFLAQTFKDANAVYTMTPPRWDAPHWKDWIGGIGRKYADAVRSAGVKFVVNLSSVGAHLPDGVGPVSGLYKGEQALNALEDVNVLHLRAAYFYENFLTFIAPLKTMGIFGSNFAVREQKFAVASPEDIAAAAAEELLPLKFRGHAVRYIASDEASTDQIAATLGTAIGKADLKWSTFPDEQMLSGLLQAGLPEEIARNYTEMNAAIGSGAMYEDYWKHQPATLGKVKLNDFAAKFARVYGAN